MASSWKMTTSLPFSSRYARSSPGLTKNPVPDLHSRISESSFSSYILLSARFMSSPVSPKFQPWEATACRSIRRGRLLRSGSRKCPHRVRGIFPLILAMEPLWIIHVSGNVLKVLQIKRSKERGKHLVTQIRNSCFFRRKLSETCETSGSTATHNHGWRKGLPVLFPAFPNKQLHSCRRCLSTRPL